jgi:hypothetical protein
MENETITNVTETTVATEIQPTVITPIADPSAATPVEAPAETKPAKTKGKIGAPKKTISFPTENEFTIKQFQQVNPGICELTLRNRVKEGLANNTLFKTRAIKTGKPGAPSFMFSLNAPSAPVETEVVSTSPTDAIASETVAS